MVEALLDDTTWAWVTLAAVAIATVAVGVFYRAADRCEPARTVALTAIGLALASTTIGITLSTGLGDQLRLVRATTIEGTP